MNRLIARRATRSLLGFAVALGLASTATAASVPAPGLHAAGSISYDAEGVPTVIASSDEDAAWLMGYAHARDRFFQMDLLRRTASGTLAELVGSPGLSQDIELRTLGLRRAAWDSWVDASDELRGQLKAYADGVNTWLAQGSLPLEYSLLELTSADPWTPVDSMAIGKLLAFQLSFDLDIDYTVKLGAFQQAGAAAGFNGNALFFEDLFRVAPPDGRISIPGFQPGMPSVAGEDEKFEAVGKSAYEGIPMLPDRMLSLAENYRDRIADNKVIAPHLKRRENRAGSNWWMVSGDHTASGRPILSNDPHLSLDTPVLFQEGHVISNDSRYPQPLNSVGAIAPGTPVPILGCTMDFCWGLTTNSLDVTDAYFEQFVLNTYGLPTHTMYDGEAEPVLWVFQSYYVNHTGDGVTDNVERNNDIGYLNGGITILVPRRNNGPVLDIDGDHGISVAYTGWSATHELDAFRRINRATNLDEFQAAVLDFDVGSQNFGYVDKEGNIAYFVSAEAPIREDLQQMQVNGAPPFIIREGTGGNEWLPAENHYEGQHSRFEILSPAEMPQVVNPASGYIANANNDPVGVTLDNNALNQVRPAGGLYYLAPGYSAYRMGRIDRELQALIDRGNITVTDMMALQANNQLMDAELVTPHLVAAFDNAPACAAATDSRVAEAIDYLRDWDFSTPTGIVEGWDPGLPAGTPPSQAEIDASVAATLFAVWRGQVVRSTVDATLAQVGLSGYTPGSRDAWNAFKHMLDVFPAQQGHGASGLDFFSAGLPADVASDATADERRDCVLLGSLVTSLDLLSGDNFALAFGHSADISDYRWGRLHRIVFDHPLSSQLSIPGAQGYPFSNLAEGLPGLPRPGGYQSVDAASHGVRADSDNDFMFGSGPVRRFIGEMTDTPTLLQILPGGQNGNIGDASYVSQLPRWLVNAYKPLVIDPAESAANEVGRIDFMPQ
ncbi:MAG: penicillin acylase family protein [Xanthomonadales bacterium]|nr:penicillin acylase family protein [Xanthomonadales bacterium]